MQYSILSIIFICAFARPAPAESSSDYELNNLTSPYTLTAYVPWNSSYNGLKVNDLNLFQAKTSQYCPFVGDQAYLCPNGTDMAFVGTLIPDCEVPGGQDLYVTADGQLQITVQHSHAFPPGSYPEYVGWTWTALPVQQPSMLLGCPTNDPVYNCASPTGYFQFKAPDATVGGLFACPNLYDNKVTSLYAVTPSFNRTGCVPLLGLGTHEYKGVNPPVWAYY